MFQPAFDPEVEAPPTPQRTPEAEESIRKSQAASEFVTVQQVASTPVKEDKQDPI